MGGPYAASVASLGGLPTVNLDIPVCAVLLLLYISFAATNMTIFQVNKRRQHKFVLNALMFGFCMSRIVTLTLRIVWATRQHNIRIAIASTIFVNAGILLLYIINLILAQRILRAMQPQVGWNTVLRASYKVMYISLAAALIMVITSTVITVYTLNPHIKSICRDILLAAVTYLLVFTALPIIHLIIVLILPRRSDAETFGKGSLESKMVIVALSTCLCVLIAGFKTGVSWGSPRPIFMPAWYHSKACFYIFNFMCEIITLGILTFSRIDQRFFVPNGSKKAGDYSQQSEESFPEREKEVSSDDVTVESR
ncbi:hypothetical protein BJ875DRAFT_545088 [Amylocarpus encephaloides]|uniref:Uncharacterized protein n=1 Tax=Amylocarpus encephaloides TaxID=45428 RepID=A0A9P7YDL1_9HELO|nr:hypothetical protein BJ875DRAFT_545088 [Amylocarpus encephaloides]